jgi:hypothetical protein
MLGAIEPTAEKTATAFAIGSGASGGAPAGGTNIGATTPAKSAFQVCSRRGRKMPTTSATTAPSSTIRTKLMADGCIGTQGVAVAIRATELLKEPITSRIQYGMSPIATTSASSGKMARRSCSSACRRLRNPRAYETGEKGAMRRERGAQAGQGGRSPGRSDGPWSR